MGTECTSNDLRRPGGDSPKFILNHFQIPTASLSAFHLFMLPLWLPTLDLLLLFVLFVRCYPSFLSAFYPTSQTRTDPAQVFLQHSSSAGLFSEGQTPLSKDLRGEGLRGGLMRLEQWWKMNFTESRPSNASTCCFITSVKSFDYRSKSRHEVMVMVTSNVEAYHNFTS